MSERRACKAIGFCRMTIRYETSRSDDHDLREQMKALARERRRFGYRRLHVLLRREGHLVNHMRLLRLYREEKLTVRKRAIEIQAIVSQKAQEISIRGVDQGIKAFKGEALGESSEKIATITITADNLGQPEIAATLQETECH